jgi:hypothetical protein
MSAPRAEQPRSEPGEKGLTRTYIQVIVIEAIVILALFCLGRYFA